MFKRYPLKLDFLRLFAAVLVTAGHARALTFADFDSQEKIGIAKFAFFWITSLGHASVILFFVLSGFLVGGGTVKSVLESKFDIYTILINRLTRIWIALIPSLLLIFALNQITCQRLTTASYCRGGLPHNLSGNPTESWHSFDLFLKTVFFVIGKEERDSFFGGNQVLWTLQYEVSSYLVIIALAFVASSFLNIQRTNETGNNRIPFHNVATLLFLGYWIYSQELGKEFLLYFLMFVFGTVSYLYWYYRKPFNGYRTGALSLIITLILLGQVARYFPIKVIVGRVSISDLAFSVVIALLLSIAAIPKPSKFEQKVDFRNINFSFSLYLLHLPIQGVILGVNQNLDHYSENSLIVFAEMLLMPIIFAKIFAIMTEDKTVIARKKILTWMRKR